MQNHLSKSHDGSCYFFTAATRYRHGSARGVAKNQPAKLAAMEGHYDSFSKADLYLGGFVNNKTQTTTGIRIPGGLSFMVHGDFSAPVKGLNAFPKEDRPPQVNSVFQFYHMMIACGVSMILLSLYASWLWFRKNCFTKMAPRNFRVECYLTTDRQPGRMVYRRNGPPAMGRVWNA